MTRLDKILYLTLGLALAAVLELDGTFMANMRRAIGPIDDINPWVAGLGGAFERQRCWRWSGEKAMNFNNALRGLACLIVLLAAIRSVPCSTPRPPACWSASGRPRSSAAVRSGLGDQYVSRRSSGGCNLFGLGHDRDPDRAGRPGQQNLRRHLGQ